MTWYEIKIDTVTEAVEMIYPIMYDLNLSGIVTQDPNDPIYSAGYAGDWDYFEESARQFDYDGARLIAYIELAGSPAALIADLEQRINALKAFNVDVGPLDITAKAVVEADWANEWKKYYKPHHITAKIVIVPQWESYAGAPDELLITLNPGKAFGTGTHETTGLCAGFIEKYAASANVLYDVGCGSGILAIIGRKLGIKNVAGVDVSEDAVVASRENMALNDIADITFVKGDMSCLPAPQGDVIVANIIADVIVDLAPQIVEKLAPNGVFIGSGILNSRLSCVVDALKAVGMTIVEQQSRAEWSALVAKRDNE